MIHTAATIVTFLMVFLIQNTQNRDTQALQLKLDELIRATRGARNLMLALDKMDDDQLKRLQALYEKLGEKEKAEEIKTKAGKRRLETREVFFSTEIQSANKLASGALREICPTAASKSISASAMRCSCSVKVNSILG